jgi:sortase A
VARVEIPAIDVDKIVVHGVDVDDLRLGPGHFPGTPLPGQAGNASIAGHRTTYGAPFFDLDQLVEGDEIFVETIQGRFEYRVTSLEIVDPSAVEVILPKGDNRLTFTTCHPKYSAAQRLIVVSELVGEPAPGGPQALDATPIEVDTDDLVLPTEDGLDAAPSSAGSDATDNTSTTPDAEPVDGPTPTSAAPVVELDTSADDLIAAISAGTDVGGGIGGGGPILPVLIWGALLGVIWAGGWMLGRRWRQLPAYAMTAIFFIPALFIFYDRVARLLPENF